MGSLMARPKSKGAYVPLAAQYFMDDAVLEAGPDAELLFVRCLSFLASVPSDGFITDRQVRTIVGLGLRNVSKRLTTLQEVGLISAVEGGFVVRSWTKWNKTAEEIGRLLAKDRERKAQKTGEEDPNSERNEDGFHPDSELQSRAVQSRAEQVSAEESDAEGVDVAERYTPQLKELCERVAEMVRANGHQVGDVGKTWWQACDRLVRLDGYSLEQVEIVARWATSDEFWAANIRSMSKLREKFSTLRAQRNTAIARTKPAPIERARNVIEMGTRMQAAVEARPLAVES